MARKATDLLDVFRFSNEGGDGGGKPPRKRSRGGGRGDGKKKRSKRRFEGLFLNARQILLASSALLLLLVLSFVLGLATGRGGDETPTKLARSDSGMVAIRVRLPVVNPATRRPAQPGAIKKQLCQDYDITPEHIRIGRSDAELVIEIGPFHTQAEAKRFIERSGLDMAHLHMENPFRYAEYVAYRR